MTKPMMQHDLVDLIDWYLLESGGDRWRFKHDYGQPFIRLGQAFFNALSIEDQRKLSGSIWDPFYSPGGTEGRVDVMLALDFLTKK